MKNTKTIIPIGYLPKVFENVPPTSTTMHESISVTSNSENSSFYTEKRACVNNEKTLLIFREVFSNTRKNIKISQVITALLAQQPCNSTVNMIEHDW